MGKAICLEEKVGKKKMLHLIYILYYSKELERTKI